MENTNRPGMQTPDTSEDEGEGEKKDGNTAKSVDDSKGPKKRIESDKGVEVGKVTDEKPKSKVEDKVSQ